jgi:hypothetical protein
MSALILLASSVRAKPDDPLEFYNVAATIMPVLFLALVYQANVVKDERESPVSRLSYTYIFVASAAVAEITSLRVLATQHASTRAEGVVVVGLVYIGIALVSEPLTDAIALVAKHHKLGKSRALLLTLAVIGGLTLQILLGTGLL